MEYFADLDPHRVLEKFDTLLGELGSDQYENEKKVGIEYVDNLMPAIRNYFIDCNDERSGMSQDALMTTMKTEFPNLYINCYSKVKEIAHEEATIAEHRESDAER